MEPTRDRRSKGARPTRSWHIVVLFFLTIVLFTGPQLLAAEDNSSPEKKGPDVAAAAGLLELVIDIDAESARKCLAALREHVESQRLLPAALAELKTKLAGPLTKISQGPPDGPLVFDAALLAAAWKDPAAIALVRRTAGDARSPAERRTAALNALARSGDKSVLPLARDILRGTAREETELRAAVLSALGKLDDPEVAATVLGLFPGLDPALQAATIDLLTQRAAWARRLLAAVAEKKIAASAVTATQVLRMQALPDKELAQQVAAQFGTVRAERNPQREKVIAQVQDLLRKTPGDPVRGQAAFAKLCIQCHKIHGAGQEVGPDITLNGRASFEQLLSNVLDPSLVIGAGYQARTLVTTDGRVISGLVVEENQQRVVLRLQGGKEETVTRDQVERLVVSPVSLMPEGIENQYTPQELADLFAFLALDRPPSDPAARKIPGTP